MKKIFLVILTVFLISSCISKSPAASNEVAGNEYEQLAKNERLVMERMRTYPPQYSTLYDIADLLFAFRNAYPTSEVFKITSDVLEPLGSLLDKMQRIESSIAEHTELFFAAIVNGDSSILIIDLIQQTEIILAKIDSLQPDIEALDEMVDVLHNAMRRYGFEFMP